MSCIFCGCSLWFHGIATNWSGVLPMKSDKTLLPNLYEQNKYSEKFSSHNGYDRSITEGDIGVCGIAVLANFSCGISVILILNCGIAVFSKPAGCVLFTFWSTIFGTKTYSLLFPTIFSRFGSNLKQPYFVTHFNHFKAVSLFPLSHRLFLPLFCPRVNEYTSYTGLL